MSIRDLIDRMKKPKKAKLLDELPYKRMKVHRAINTGTGWKPKEEKENDEQKQ